MSNAPEEGGGSERLKTGKNIRAFDDGSGLAAMWKSSIPAFLHMKPIDSVPTNSGCCASPPDHAELEHRRKLCVRTTPFAWLINNDSARSEQGRPILVGPASVLPPPPPHKASRRRFLVAKTKKRRPVGATVVLRCRSLRERMAARIHKKPERCRS